MVFCCCRCSFVCYKPAISPCSPSGFYSQMLIRFQDMVRRGEIIDNDTEDEFYLRRLDAGLFVLQHICYIMAEICNASVPQVGGPALPGPG